MFIGFANAKHFGRVFRGLNTLMNLAIRYSTSYTLTSLSHVNCRIPRSQSILILIYQLNMFWQWGVAKCYPYVFTRNSFHIAIKVQQRR